MEVELEIIDVVSKKSLAKLCNLTRSSTIGDVKRSFQNCKPSYYVERQSFKIEQRGKTLHDNETLQNLGLEKGGKIFFKDLGHQIGWSTVFLAEYAGPLFVYLGFYLRPYFVYGDLADSPRCLAMNVSCACWVLHYLKRLYETVFVHRFSHSTMPILNLFKNCSYYWGFTAFVAYFNNHPLYTPPMFGTVQLFLGLAGFLLCEFGNYSIHVALRDLRPEGTLTRKIPKPTSNPMTALFGFVSCPNYTYEFGSWLCFSVLSQSFPALIFSIVGFAQMSIWALGKHNNYRKEFSDYPRSRKAIVPFLL